MRSLLLVTPLVVSIAHADPAARWERLDLAAGPSPRRDAGLAYDRDRRRVLLFGGRDASGALDDTWALDLATGAWREIVAGGSPRPPARFSFVTGIDVSSRSLVVAVGQGDGGFLDDAWGLDLATDTWRELPGEGARPLARYGAAGGSFDSGGFAPSGAPLVVSHGFTDSGRFDDTAVLAEGGDSWTEATPGGVLPLKRCLSGSAAISETSLALFGGCASGFGPCPLDDTWILDLATSRWTQVGPGARPSARTFPAMAALGDRRHAVLFGGDDGEPRNDTWVLDALAGTWTAVTPAGPAPEGRSGASLVFVNEPGRTRDGGGCGSLLLFGGASSSALLADTWLLHPSRQPGATLLRVRKRDEGVELEWVADASVSRWEAWRSTAPAFAPEEARLVESVTGGTDGRRTLLDVPSPDRLLCYVLRQAACW